MSTLAIIGLVVVIVVGGIAIYAATYGWDGDKNAGQGSIEILDSTPPQKIVLKLDFVKPFEAHNKGEFLLLRKSGTTDVTWAIHGPNTFMSTVMGLFINIDKMVGRDFEQGLADLKAIVEK
jgi:hypothetical protein